MCDSNLSAAKFFIYIASYKYYSSVHACAEIISDHRPVIFLTIKVKQYKHTACHIFAEKIPCLAACDNNRVLFFISFHMYAHPIANIAADMQLTAPHAVSKHIACIAVDNNLAAVHCVADIILGVVFYDKRGAVHECGEVVSRHAVYRSEEHTSELQSQFHLVCRLLLEKKN